MPIRAVLRIAAVTQSNYPTSNLPCMKIKVTDPYEVLTPAEVSYLTEKLNEREMLKRNLHTHARTVMDEHRGHHVDVNV